MPTELEQLSVSLSARIDDFKKNMQAAVREFDQGANQIERRNLQLTESIAVNMRGAGSAIKYLTGAFQGVIYVAFFEKLIRGSLDANKSLVDLARTADLARVSTERLQQVQFAAKRLGGVDPTDVIKSAHDLSERVYKETREGEGELTTILKANNMTLVDRNGKAKDFNQLLDMAATLLQRASSEAQAIDIGRLFNLSEDMVRALEKGPAAFKRMQDEAKASGAIIDQSVIDKAVEFDKLWNQSWSNFSTYAKSAAVAALEALAPVGTWLENRFKNLPGYLAAVSKGINAAEGGGAEETDAERLARASGISVPGGLFRDRGVTTGQRFGPNLPSINDPRRGKDAAAKSDQLDSAEKSIRKQTIALDAQAAALTKTGTEAAFLEAQTKLLEVAQEAGIKVTDEKRKEIDKLSMAYAKASEHLKEMKLDTDLAFERSQVFRTSDEQAIATRTRGLDPDAAERVANSMREIQNLTEGKEMAGSFVKGLVADLENGVRAGQALENQLKKILEKLADKAIDKLISSAFGGIGGGFGGLFGGASTDIGGAAGYYGPGFASGGLVGRDGTPTWIPASALRGARQFASGGGMPAILHAGEIVLSKAQQANVARGLTTNNQGPINLTHAPVINGTGLSADQVYSVIQRSQKDFARQIGPIFSDWQRRHG